MTTGNNLTGEHHYQKIEQLGLEVVPLHTLYKEPIDPPFPQCSEMWPERVWATGDVLPGPVWLFKTAEPKSIRAEKDFPSITASDSLFLPITWYNGSRLWYQSLCLAIPLLHTISAWGFGLENAGVALPHWAPSNLNFPELNIPTSYGPNCHNYCTSRVSVLAGRDLQLISLDSRIYLEITHAVLGYPRVLLVRTSQVPIPIVPIILI